MAWLSLAVIDVIKLLAHILPLPGALILPLAAAATVAAVVETETEAGADGEALQQWTVE